MAARGLSPWQRVAGHAVLAFLSAIFLLPLLWLVATSLKADEDLMRIPDSPDVLLPQAFFTEIDGRRQRVLPGKKLSEAHVIVRRSDNQQRQLVKRVDYQHGQLRQWRIENGKPTVFELSAEEVRAIPAQADALWWHVVPISATGKDESAWDCVADEDLQRGIHLETRNYSEGLGERDFASYYFNSILVSLPIVFLSVLVSSYVAYGFGVLQWPGRDLVFLVLLATMMLPPQVTMIPIFVLFKKLDWIDTYRPLIAPALFGNVFFIFLLRQYYRGLPISLFDAARVDGCSEIRIWWSIVLPLSKPALMVVGLFAFLNAWNDFLGPLIYLTSQQNYTLPIALALLRGEYGSEYGLLMAMTTLTILPVIVLFFLAQRSFIQGIHFSGEKG